MGDAMLGRLDLEGRFGEVGEGVQKFVEGIIVVADEIDRIRFKSCCKSSWDD